MAANELAPALIDGKISKDAVAVLATIGLKISDAVGLMLAYGIRQSEYRSSV